jgi:Domain of unknown function (DUF5606)
MEFDDIISVSGKPGLYKILKAGNSGYIVQELRGSKKLVLGNQHRVSFLKEISLYTTSTEGSVPIQVLYEKIQKDPGLLPEKISDSLPAPRDAFGTGKQGGKDLYAPLKRLLPDFDAERIYPSDLKKFFKWYQVLIELDPKMDFSMKKENKKVKGDKEAKEKKKETNPEKKKQ